MEQGSEEETEEVKEETENILASSKSPKQRLREKEKVERLNKWINAQYETERLHKTIQEYKNKQEQVIITRLTHTKYTHEHLL